MKNIGILFDEMHDFIEHIACRIRDLGGRVTFVHYSELVLACDSANPLKNLDSVYLDRMGERTQGYTTQLMLLAGLEKGEHAVPVVNAPSAYWVARNKALMYQALWNNNIPIPETAIVYGWEHIESFVSKHSCTAVVVKSLLGHSSDEVFIHPEAGSKETIDDLLNRDGMAVVQKYVERQNRFIWRVDIVNGVVVNGTRDYAYNAEQSLPLCNTTRGSVSECVTIADIPAAVVDCCIEAVNTLNLVVAGVDVIIDDFDKVYIIEVNPEPGGCSAGDFTNAIADYLLAMSSDKK